MVNLLCTSPTWILLTYYCKYSILLFDISVLDSLSRAREFRLEFITGNYCQFLRWPYFCRSLPVRSLMHVLRKLLVYWFLRHSKITRSSIRLFPTSSTGILRFAYLLYFVFFIAFTNDSVYIHKWEWWHIKGHLRFVLLIARTYSSREVINN